MILHLRKVHKLSKPTVQSDILLAQVENPNDILMTENQVENIIIVQSQDNSSTGLMFNVELPSS